MTIKTLQTIVDWPSCKDEQPGWSENFIEDYMGLKEDVSQLLEIVNDGLLSPQSGAGSPEGVITANYSLMYVDLTGPNVLYFNPTFGANTGWVSVT